MSLIKPKAPRWYKDENGVVEACYRVPVKNKKLLMDEGHPGTKEPTIKDARELGLLPSVTTILSVMAKPGLERWKLEQAIHSALTLPRMDEHFDIWIGRIFPCGIDGYSAADLLKRAYHHGPSYAEPEDAFAKLVVQDMEAQSSKAAEFGTRIHDAIAAYFSRNYTEGDPAIRPFLESFYVWANENIEEVHAVEKVVGGKHCGYAGRMDLDCTLKGIGRTICDFKTQGVKEGKEPVFYEDDWLPQLSAYRNASTDCVPRIMSLVIGSRTPGPVWPRLWEPGEVVKGLRMFDNCYELWALRNDHEPGG